MKHINAFVRVLLVTVAATFWWFEFVPVVLQVARKVAPGLDYTLEFLFSFNGFSAIAIFGTTAVGVLLFLLQLASRLADWVYTHPEINSTSNEKPLHE
jgi:hypothetical protein